MKVLYLLNFAGKGGTERYVETLVRYLNGTHIEAFFAYNQDGPLVEKLQSLGVPCRRVEMRRRFDFRAARELASLCREWDIDLVHCQFLREHYTALLAKQYNAHIRVVYTHHILQSNNAVTRLTNRLLDRRQDMMLAVCTKGREQLIANGWSGDRVRVIFNAVDAAAWAGGPAESTLRSEIGVDGGRFVLLYAARFVEGKGHAPLIDAMALLKGRTALPFTLALAGDGPLLEPVKQQVRDLGLEDRVAFLGFRQDMKNLYKGADLCVCPSQQEALSFFLIEAMVSGLPVVATDVGGNSDIVNDDAGDGLLVPYGDPDAMAEAIRRMMEDKPFREQCRENALRAIQEKFEIHGWMDKILDAYRAALSR